jgi:hypothetical protein
MMRLLPILILCFMFGASASGAVRQGSVPLTNDDVIRLKKAGLRDDLIILAINSSPTKFKTDPSDLVVLKDAGLSEGLITAIVRASTPTSGTAAPTNTTADLSRAALIDPFGTSVTHEDAAGLPDATRAAVIQILKSKKMFSALLSPEDAAGRKALVEISAELVDFAPGNVATRLVIGLGTGRAHAGYNFVVKDASGKVLWRKTIKETASFWSNSASSSAQRSELPEKVAKSFVEELQKAKIGILAQ